MHKFSENVLSKVSRDFFVLHQTWGYVHGEREKKSIPSFVESRASSFGQNRRSTSTNSFKYGVRPISIRTHAFRRGGEIPMPVMLETLLINLRRKFSNSEK